MGDSDGFDQDDQSSRLQKAVREARMYGISRGETEFDLDQIMGLEKSPIDLCTVNSVPLLVQQKIELSKQGNRVCIALPHRTFWLPAQTKPLDEVTLQWLHDHKDYILATYFAYLAGYEHGYTKKKELANDKNSRGQDSTSKKNELDHSKEQNEHER